MGSGTPKNGVPDPLFRVFVQNIVEISRGKMRFFVHHNDTTKYPLFEDLHLISPFWRKKCPKMCTFLPPENAHFCTPFLTPQNRTANLRYKTPFQFPNGTLGVNLTFFKIAKKSVAISSIFWTKNTKNRKKGRFLLRKSSKTRKNDPELPLNSVIFIKKAQKWPPNTARIIKKT